MHPTPIAAALAASSDLPSRQLLKWMFRFIRPVLGLALIACFYLTGWVIVEVLSSRQAGITVNFIKTLHTSQSAAGEGFVRWITSVDTDAGHLRHLIFVLASLVALYALLRYLREVANTKMSMEMVFYIREAIYDKVQRVGFGFHDAISSGQLINRALSDLQNVRSFVQTAILTTLEIIEAVLFYIALIYTRNHWLAALALVPLPIWTWYVLRFSKKVQPVAKSVMEAEDRNVSIITESIAGVHVIKAFATERQEIAKYGANCDTFKERVLTRIRLFADFNPVIRSIAQVSYLSLFLVAGILTIKGRLGPGDFLILGGAMSAILARLQAVATINEQYQNAMVSARRLYEVLMAPPTVPEKPGARPLPVGIGEVSFERVSFGYTPDKTVLRDVNFRVKGGSVVAVVGPTGAGKTTLVNLLSRFYDPHQGRILIDSVDLREVTLASLRTQVAFVFQETYLFSDTVAANIAYGRPNITPGEIEAAARLAQAHEFIEQMPKQYEAVLSEKGSSLSGGQRQRLAIARAILTNPRVLILDDATAAIDPETEDLIRRGMRFVMHGRTTFIIAHRISTVKAADLVIVLEHGRIAQMGTHDQLMREDGHYREIAAAQLSVDDEDVEQAADRAAQPAPAARAAKAEEQPSHMDRMQDEKHVADAAEDADRSAAAAAPMAK
jgi:ABC-type multidrug transport system fused ATPase/permease subunit